MQLFTPLQIQLNPNRQSFILTNSLLAVTRQLLRLQNKILLFFVMAIFKLRGAFNKFPDFFCTGIYNCRKLEIFQYVVTILLMR